MRFVLRRASTRARRLVLLFQFREQPDVLDRDDRLGREGLKERDLFLGEGATLHPRDADRADRLIISQHRHGEPRPEPGLHDGSRGILGILPHVRDVSDRAGQDRSRDRARSAGRDRKHAVDGIQRGGCPAMVCHQVNQTKHARVRVLTQGCRASRDRFEGRFDVGRRTRDDPQDLARRRLLL
jgi:hypothetical protein